MEERKEKMILICLKCRKPVPDSVHNFIAICSCKTEKEWIKYFKKKKYVLRINGKVYDFTEYGAKNKRGKKK